MVLSNEIRILDLLPAPSNEPEAPIKCELRTVTLASKPDYEALSYVWGSDAKLIEIEVSEQKVGVTPNLYAGLKRLRRPHGTRSLWIDQLCINQWDTQEKAEQVRLMRDIYSNCRNCQIWMGEIAEDIPLVDAEQALEFIKYMAALADAEDADSVPKPPSFKSSKTFEGPMKALQTLSYEADICNGNPWWGRVWTVQEAVLPPQATISWGPLLLPWSQLYKATRPWVGDGCGLPWEVWELLETPNVSFLGDIMAMIIWLEIAKQRDDGPVAMINRWRFRHATDPRDKIYALLGLCVPGSLPSIEKCDYDLPPVEVFCSLTIELFVSEEGLRPLVMDPRLEIERATPGMPRWAIDVAQMGGHNTDWYHIYGYEWYNACADQHIDLRALQTRAQKDPKTLELKGVYVDTVEVVGEPFYKPHMDIVKATHFYLEHLRTWEALAKQHAKLGTDDSSKLYPGGFAHREAFARVMMGDLMRDSEQHGEEWATEEHVERFYSHLQDGDDSDMQKTAGGMMKNQNFFITKTGLMGVGHLDTKPGDEVWIFQGGRVPFTVTPREGGGPDDYDFGGKCYVQGIMKGEVFGFDWTDDEEEDDEDSWEDEEEDEEDGEDDEKEGDEETDEKDEKSQDKDKGDEESDDKKDEESEEEEEEEEGEEGEEEESCGGEKVKYFEEPVERVITLY